MDIIYIALGILLSVVIIVIVQANRKVVYGKTVYQELEKTSDGQQLKYIMNHHGDEELRINMTVMQVEILKRAYKENVAPSDAAQAIIGALDEMLQEHEQAC